MQVSSSVVEVFIEHINVTILSGVDYDTWSCQCFIEPSVSKILSSSLSSSLNLKIFIYLWSTSWEESSKVINTSLTIKTSRDDETGNVEVEFVRRMNAVLLDDAIWIKPVHWRHHEQTMNVAAVLRYQS